VNKDNSSQFGLKNTSNERLNDLSAILGVSSCYVKMLPKVHGTSCS